MSSSDFILMEPADAAGVSSGKWTDQETLLLLEALELFNENWSEIAEHVATKTKAQCILHFLQMPIEDTFRDCDDEDNVEKKDKSSDENDKKKDKSLDENDEKKDKSLDEIDEKKDKNLDGFDEKKDKSLDENDEKIDKILDENDEKIDITSDENDEKKDKSFDENNEKKEVGQSQQENEEKMEVDQENGDLQDSKEIEDPKANNDQPDSCSMEITGSVDNNRLKDNNQENGVNIALKALREAFDAVGSLSSPDEKLCFTDAGNPVMALAAFLTRLVEPNIVTASARTSLKSMSSGGTGLQLSARHSFVLEDPTDGTKKPDDTDRDLQDVVEQEVLKESTNSCNKQEEEKENTKLTENEKEKQLISVEKKEHIVEQEVVEQEVLKESTNSCNKQEEEKENTKLTENENEKEKQLISDRKKEDIVTAEVAVSKKGRNIGTRRKGASKKDNDLVTGKPAIVEEVNKQRDEVENASSSKKETEVSGDGGPRLGLADSQSTETPKDEEMVEKAEPSLSTLAENTPNSGCTKAKNSQNANKDFPDAKDDPNMHKLTHAAVTAISAAAVKAKFLADQEEDQIRQLATSLIEKQLHKLETKLTFFTEMDGVISRAREQLERSKQRLYQERAQIIAARLGMSGGASSRPMPNPLQRPLNPMSMTPQRPQLSRPMMAPTPSLPNTAGLTPSFPNTAGPTPPFPNTAGPTPPFPNAAGPTTVAGSSSLQTTKE